MANDYAKIFAKRLNHYMVLNNKKQIDLSNELNINTKTLSTWCRGEKMPKMDKIQILANYFGIKVSDLVEEKNDNESALYPPDISVCNVEFPVIGDVAAGYDKIALEEWTGDRIKVPCTYLKGRQPEDFFVLNVKGDSMYPMYIDGDKVLVLKQSATDYNGQVAVLIYGDDYGTIKKVEQKKDSVDLVPINPQYPPEHITKENIEKIHILGIPTLLVRELEENE